MNQKKHEDQPQDSMDDAGLDFQLNAAIESNPFQKRRANKAAVGQSTEVPKPQTTTSYSTVQKSTENITPTTSTTSLAYKKTTYPEPIKSNTEVPKKEEVPTQYQRPTYPTTTQATQPQQASVSQVEPGKVNPTPYTPYTQTSAYKTPIPANITRTVPPTVSQPTSTINPVQGTTATIPTTTAQINRPDLTKTTVPSVQSGQTAQNERPPYTSALGSLVGSTTTQANKPVTTTPPYTQIGLNKEVPPTSTLGSTTTGTTGTTGITSVPKPELNKPTTVVPPTQQAQNERPPFASALSSLTGGSRPPVTQTGAGVQVTKPEIARPTTVTPPTTGILNKDTLPPTGDRPPTSSALGGITSTAKPPTTVTNTTTSPPVQNERPPTTSALGNLIGQRTTATTVPTQGVTQPPVVTSTKTPVTTTTVNQETPPVQGEKSIASALGSLVGQTGSGIKTENKQVPPPTFIPPATKTPVTVIPRTSPTKLVTPTPIVQQTQASTLINRPKQDPVTQSRELTKMAQTPKKIFATFNNNRGFMLVGSKIKGKTIDVQATRLGPLIQDTLAYPGPYKFDKKTLGDKKIELSKFLEKKLEDNKAYLPYKLSLLLLNEYLNNNSTNIFTTQDNSQSKEKISQELHRHSLEQSLTTVAKEYTEFFNFSNSYLSDLNNPSVQDANGEDLLFKALFLRNTAFNIDPANIDYILHYVKSRFAPGDPLHTVSMVKLSLFHEIFETEFFLESDINDLWPIWIYPCLRYSDFIPIHQVRDFLNSFALKILERKNNNRYGMVSLFVAMLSGDFDLETFDKIMQSSRNTEFIQVLETYYYVLKATNPNYDKNYDVIPKVLPLLLRYASSLVDMGMFERGKEYLDYIVALRPFYKGLEGNITFLSQVRVLRDFVVNNYTLLEEAKNAQKQQTNFLSNIASKKDMATNAIKNIQAKSKGIFGFMGSALSNFINANEAANAGENNEEELKQAETSSASTSESIFSSFTKPTVDTTKAKLGASPQQEVIQPPSVHSPTHDFQIEEGGEQVKVDPSKQGKNFMSNPFASKVGGPAPSQGDNSSTRKGIPKNRYVPI